MSNQVVDYTFTIIEDGQVPLAGNFDTFNYTPVIVTVVLGLIVLAVLAYSLWFETHRSRVKVLCSEVNLKARNFFFRPTELLRYESELEHAIVSTSIKEI